MHKEHVQEEPLMGSHSGVCVATEADRGALYKAFLKRKQKSNTTRN